jgi:hypothetical protein
MVKLTQARLRYLLHYDATTGFFTWLVRRGRQAAGTRAGTVNKKSGYVLICIDGHFYYGHRLAWFYAHGSWPVEFSDHENRTRYDNRLENLRPANRSQNMGNIAPNARNTSGYRGVSWCKSKRRWAAYINRENRKVHLGRHSTAEDAARAYNVAAMSHFGAFAVLNEVAL